jgi:hypothetical protein
MSHEATGFFVSFVTVKSSEGDTEQNVRAAGSSMLSVLLMECLCPDNVTVTHILTVCFRSFVSEGVESGHSLPAGSSRAAVSYSPFKRVSVSCGHRNPCSVASALFAYP